MTERNRINRGDANDLEPLFPGHKWLSAWNSPESFGRYVKDLDRGKAWNGAGWDANQDRNSWAGTKSMEEALNLAAGNWKQGRELIERVTNAVKLAYPIKKQPIKYNVVGVIPSVPRAVAGDPKNMIEPDLGRAKRKTTITLVSDMSANWTVDAQCFVARAAVLAALIDTIETAGYSCEVIAVAHSKGDNGTVCSAIRIKESHQPLDLARCAFGLGHPSMFRRMIFADWGGNSENRQLGYGLGHCSKMEFTDKQRDQKIYYIPNLEGRVQHYFQNEKTAVEHGLHLFVEVLTLQGCPAFNKDPKDFKYYFKDKIDPETKREFWQLRRLSEITGKTDKSFGFED